MKSLKILLQKKAHIRVIGFDDAPFAKQAGSPVSIAGVVCAGTLFEGLLWGVVEKDGSDATETIASLFCESKFYEQVHLILLDGIAVGGFNLIDLPEMADRTKRPCVSLMRRMPDLRAMKKALLHFPDSNRRIRILEKAGPVHHADPYYFQVAGETPQVITQVFGEIARTGNMPEALRIAHLIGAAVITGQSGNRA